MHIDDINQDKKGPRKACHKVVGWKRALVRFERIFVAGREALYSLYNLRAGVAQKLDIRNHRRAAKDYNSNLYVNFIFRKLFHQS